MKITSTTISKPTKSDIYYQRRRLQNNIYHDVMDRFVELAQTKGLTKKQLAESIDKDTGWLSKTFSKPGNWTLRTISDLLIAMESELSHEVTPLETEAQDVILDNVVRLHSYTPPIKSNSKFSTHINESHG